MDDGPALRELRLQIGEIEGRVKRIEVALRGDPEWDKAGLLAEAKELRSQQGRIERMVEAIEREQERREQERKDGEAEEKERLDKREDVQRLYLQLVLSGMVTLIVGLAVFFVQQAVAGG